LDNQLNYTMEHADEEAKTWCYWCLCCRGNSSYIARIYNYRPLLKFSGGWFM